MNLEDVQELNRALVIRALRAKKVWSRADIAHATGLKQATISNIIGDFLSWGLVVETGFLEGRKGRRSIGVSLNSEEFRVIGTRLERNYVRFGLFDLLGTLEREREEPLEGPLDADTVIARMAAGVRDMISEAAPRRVLSAGVAIPGPYVRNEGRMAWVTELPGLDAVPLEQRLASAMTIPVFLEHDAKAAALAKWYLAPHSEESEPIVYVTVGQGVGAGVVLDGDLLRGRSGVAGEIGHLTIDHRGPRCACGNYGCLELYCSSTALLRELRSAADGAQRVPRKLTLARVRAAYHAGEAWATEAVERSARYLGMGLVNVINAFGPGRIIVGDEMASFGPGYLAVVQAAATERLNARVAKAVRFELEGSEQDGILAGVAALAVGNILRQGLATPEALAPAQAAGK